MRERKIRARRRKKARQERGWRESKGGRRGSRRGVVGRSNRPCARDTSDRRRDRGRKESGTAKSERREARAGGRNCVRRWGAAHPRAASLSASAFPWAKGSSEFMWAGVQEMEIELSRLTRSRRALMRAIIFLFPTGLMARVANSLTQ